MLPLAFAPESGRPFRLLCLGAHCDDIAIGCGGTILKLLGAIPGASVRWLTLTGSPRRHEEERNAAEALLAGAAKRRVETHGYREGFLPAQWGAVKEEFERLKAEFEPNLILTHTRHDVHQDHRVVAELTWNTFRDHLVLEYEIAKFEGDLGHPNLFVPLTAAAAEAKTAAVIGCYPSQRDRESPDERALMGLMRIRGVECNAPSGWAEAFHVRKMVV